MWLLDRLLKGFIRNGELILIDPKGRARRYGRPNPERPAVTIRLTGAARPAKIARNPALGAAEAFMDGSLVIEEGGEILDLLDLIAFNARWDSDQSSGPLLEAQARLTQWLRQWNKGARAKRNVAHHYDLSDRLYDLFLDSDRQYSCAYFTDPSNSLEQAQSDKKAHIAAKLLLKPGQRVLDIGCGWGGTALYLHKVADVDVLGITLSEEQLKAARERAIAAGVADRVKFELADYRSITGPFDRIVSVGMFEHVGEPQFPAFFRKCRELLADDGVMLLHTVGHADGPRPTDDFTEKYIFPGGYVPALSQIAPVVERAKLWMTDIEILRLHYAYTLMHWYERTKAARAEIVALYDERFYRMWTFYLAAFIGSFRHGALVNFQIQLTRRRDVVPLTRDYMAEAETLYRDTGARR
jgi:cyclopropane-fatty-acyl-phospholipid synthase